MPIKVLHIDDNVHDCELVSVSLRNSKSDFQLTQVASREDFERKLAEQTYDIILSDFNIFGLDGLQVIDIAHKICPNIPIIIVTGTGTEEIAVDSIKRGAADYVIKTTSHIQHLPITIQTILENKYLTDQKQKAISSLMRSENKYRKLHESMMDGFVYVDMNGIIREFNESYLSMLGYTSEELIKLTYIDLTPEKWHKFEQDIVDNQILKRGFTDVYEKEYRKKDGTIFPVELRTFLIKNEAGQNEGMWAIVRDITQRKKIDAEMRESEIKFRSIFENSVDAIGVSKMGLHTFVNPAYLTLFGYSNSQELIGKSILNLIAPSEHQDITNKIKKRAEGKYIPDTYETKGLRKDGTTFEMEVHVSGYELNGETYTLVILRDITERKRVENALLESEVLYRSLVETTRTGYVIIDTDGRVADANEEYIRLTGHNELKEIQGRSVTEWIASYEREKNTRAMTQCSKDGYIRNFEIDYVDKNGNIIPIEINATVVQWHGRPQLLTLCRNITERRHVEEAIRQSEQKLSLHFQNTPIGVIEWDADFKVTRWNPAAEKIFGYTTNEVYGHPATELIVPDNARSHVNQVWKKLLNRQGGERSTNENLTKDGRIILCEWYNTPLVTADGHVIGVASLVEDVTKRKRAEDTLAESESKFRGVAQTSIAAIFIYQENKFLYANPATETISGYPLDEFLNKQFWEIVHPDFREIIKERGFARQRGAPVPSRYEFKIVTKNGEERWLDYGASLIIVDKKPAALGIAFDITERKIIEEKLQASYQQMRQLSARLEETREKESARIAREIHDELGQILTGIKMDLSFVEDGLLEQSELPKVKKLLDIIGSSTKLVDDAINTVRKITSELRPAILDSMGLLAAIEWQTEEFQKRTGIKCTFKSPFDTIEMDKDRSIAIFRIIQESLTNILRHAKATTVAIHFTEDDGTLFFDISDNGRGISSQDMKKIGSFGILGMKERAALLGGHIDIKGHVGKGTTVSVRIPIGK